MPPSGFEPESLPRKGKMIDRTTLQGQLDLKDSLLFINLSQGDLVKFIKYLNYFFCIAVVAQPGTAQINLKLSVGLEMYLVSLFPQGYLSSNLSHGVTLLIQTLVLK